MKTSVEKRVIKATKIFELIQSQQRFKQKVRKTLSFAALTYVKYLVCAGSLGLEESSMDRIMQNKIRIKYPNLQHFQSSNEKHKAILANLLTHQKF